jgi:hypothetical protein
LPEQSLFTPVFHFQYFIDVARGDDNYPALVEERNSNVKLRRSLL